MKRWDCAGLALAAACGGPSATGDAGSGADAGGSPVDAGSYPAAFPPPPQVGNDGGLVLSSPKIVAILFPNDADPGAPVTDLDAFFRGLGGTAYWQGLAEYGVGAPSVTLVTAGQPAPQMIDDSAIRTWLLGQIGSAALPSPDPQTLYILNYPLGTTTTYNAQGWTSCNQFLAYHDDIQTSGPDGGPLEIPYAIVPRCLPSATGGATDLEGFTSSASHELVELVTDPSANNPGYVQVDDAHAFWNPPGGDASELADMCDATEYSIVDQSFPGFPYKLERFWSNAAAAAGHDPCVPATPGQPYIAAVPVLNARAPFTDFGVTFNALAVHIPVGGSAVVPLELYSDAPTAPFKVAAYDYNQQYNQGAALLSFQLSKTQGQNGDRIDLTITVHTAGGNGNTESANTELFYVESSSGAAVNDWFGLVGN